MSDKTGNFVFRNVSARRYRTIIVFQSDSRATRGLITRVCIRMHVYARTQSSISRLKSDLKRMTQFPRGVVSAYGYQCGICMKNCWSLRFYSVIRFDNRLLQRRFPFSSNLKAGAKNAPSVNHSYFNIYVSAKAPLSRYLRTSPRASSFYQQIGRQYR